MRAEVLRNAGYRCSGCGRPGRLEVDHVTPLSRGGAPYDKANLQCLCRSCHIGKSAAERHGASGMVAGQREWRDRLAKYY